MEESSSRYERRSHSILHSLWLAAQYLVPVISTREVAAVLREAGEDVAA